MESPIYDMFIRGSDLLFGWVLLLPRDFALLAVGLMTSLGIVLIRRWKTDQAMLVQIKNDLGVLKGKMKEAKQRGDKETRLRHRAVSQMISMKRMKSEGKPLLVALIPIAVLASWAFERLEFEPLHTGSPVVISLSMPVSAEGRLVHLVPDEGLEAESGWVRVFERCDDSDQVAAQAQWRVVPRRKGEFLLRFRTGDATYTHKMEAGTRRYSPVMIQHDTAGFIMSQIELPERRLLGFVPGLPSMGMPAWMVGYVIITVALVIINRRLFKVA